MAIDQPDAEMSVILFIYDIKNDSKPLTKLNSIEFAVNEYLDLLGSHHNHISV
jgi:hypothetical protein